MNAEETIGIFTIVNKRNIFEGFKESLSKQKNVKYHLKCIENCNGEYDSARKAFNENVVLNDAKYYVFTHPDIRFNDEYSLSDIISTIDTIGEFAVVGVAGARRNGNRREIVTTIFQGKEKQRVGTIIEQPVEVQTVDECFFVVRSDYFQNHKFSNRAGWHLYAVEYCLDALESGQKIFAIPARLWHISPGSSLDENYMSQLEEIIHAFNRQYDMICTTVKGWNTRGFISLVYRRYYWIKQWIKRTIVRK